MITYTETRTIKEWVGPNGIKMTVLAIYNPNEEQDPWVEFENKETKQTYTCRLEAFKLRYTPHIN